MKSILSQEAAAYLEEAKSISDRNSTAVSGEDVNYDGESVVEEMAPWYEAIWAQFGRVDSLDDFNRAADVAWSLFERHTGATRQEFSASKGNALGRWRRRRTDAPLEAFSGDRPAGVTDSAISFAERTRTDGRIPWDTADRVYLGRREMALSSSWPNPAIGKRLMGVECHGLPTPERSHKIVRETHRSVHASMLLESYAERMSRLDKGVSSIRESDGVLGNFSCPSVVDGCRWCKP